MTLQNETETDVDAKVAAKVKPRPTVIRSKGLAGSEVAGLMEMHTWRRPSETYSTQLFARHFLAPLGAKPDQRGNWHYMVDDARVMWSSHLDTVHHQSGMQSIEIDGDKLRLSERMKKKRTSNCLGSDDSAGVWLMHEMIRAGVPGYYIFHVDEEHGRLGANWLAANVPEFFKGRFDFAIAFDRRGRDSIITHQMGQRCCSHDFAVSIGKQLGPHFKADPTGSFTDTASYVKLIPECTNIAVGYEGAHGEGENLHIPHIVDLCAALKRIDVAALVVARDPLKPEHQHGGRFRREGHEDDYLYSNGYDWHGYGGGYGGVHGGQYQHPHGTTNRSVRQIEREAEQVGTTEAQEGAQKGAAQGGIRPSEKARQIAQAEFPEKLEKPVRHEAKTDKIWWDANGWSLEELAVKYPEALADALEELGFDASVLLQKNATRGMTLAAAVKQYPREVAESLAWLQCSVLELIPAVRQRVDRPN